MEPKCTGSCKWFNAKKGYGFITTSDGEDVFVHQSEVHAPGFRTLCEGEVLEFELITDNNGKKKALRVTGPAGQFVKGDGGPRSGGGAPTALYGGGEGGGGGYRGGGGGSKFQHMVFVFITRDCCGFGIADIYILCRVSSTLP
eukprot:GHVT01032893.1.p1 GENE.GHVT01032893.1~~GHVT01032893.1.p1  ORF type:complete len:143 (-),score=7.05 GHVT01032893.1:36-464(-)